MKPLRRPFRRFTLHVLRVIRYLMRMEEDPHPHATDRQRAHAALRDIDEAFSAAPPSVCETVAPLQHVLRYVIADLTAALQRNGEEVLTWPPERWPSDPAEYLDQVNRELLMASACVDEGHADVIDQIRATILTALHHERPPGASAAEKDVSLFRASVIAKSAAILDDLAPET